MNGVDGATFALGSRRRSHSTAKPLMKYSCTVRQIQCSSRPTPICRARRVALLFIAIALSVDSAAAANAEAGPRPIPAFDLPPGFELVEAANPPLVRFPIMGCVDDRGRLFVGDAAGVNLDDKALAEQLPNRVVMLEDTNR